MRPALVLLVASAAAVVLGPRPARCKKLVDIFWNVTNPMPTTNVESPGKLLPVACCATAEKGGRCASPEYAFDSMFPITG
ncbi:hypothetical protein MRX96_013937 [Rhipicephalus microplus]